MTTPSRPELFCIELITDQWAALVKWYREALGLKVLIRAVDDRYALLAAGGTRLAIVGRELKDRPGKRKTQADWSLVFEVDDLAAAEARLTDVGLAGGARQTHLEGFSELTIADPDGNTVRLIAWPAME